MRRDAAALALLVLMHCLLFESGLGGSDGWGYFANVESLVEDGDLDLANNLSPKGRGGVEGAVGTADGRLGGMPHPTVPGRIVNSYPMGKALLDLPFYLLGKGAGALLPGARFPSLEGTPYEGMPPSRMLSALGLVCGSNLCAALAVALAFLALRAAGIGRAAAWAASALAFAASPLPFYAVTGMSHAASTAFSAGLLLCWLRAHREGGPCAPGWAFGLGVLAGGAVSVRYASAPLAPALALLLLPGAGKARRLAAYAAGLAVLSWMEPLRNWMEYGHPMRTLYPALSESLVWRLEGYDPVASIPVLNLFLAPVHGILWWSPLFGAALAGMALPGRARGAAWVLLLSQCVLSGLGGSYHAGSGFSQRYLCEAMPCFALGIAVLLERIPACRGRLAAAFTVLAAWNYLLFLLSQARLARLSPEGTRLGWRLTDYLYVFDERMGAGEVLGRILSTTVPGRLGGAWAGLGAVLLVLGAAVALVLARRRAWLSGGQSSAD